MRLFIYFIKGGEKLLWYQNKNMFRVTEPMRNNNCQYKKQLQIIEFQSNIFLLGIASVEQIVALSPKRRDVKLARACESIEWAQSARVRHPPAAAATHASAETALRSLSGNKQTINRRAREGRASIKMQIGAYYPGGARVAADWSH